MTDAEVQAAYKKALADYANCVLNTYQVGKLNEVNSHFVAELEELQATYHHWAYTANEVDIYDSGHSENVALIKYCVDHKVNNAGCELMIAYLAESHAMMLRRLYQRKRKDDCIR
jgi:hypothetical protein